MTFKTNNEFILTPYTDPLKDKVLKLKIIYQEFIH